MQILHNETAVFLQYADELIEPHIALGIRDAAGFQPENVALWVPIVTLELFVERLA